MITAYLVAMFLCGMIFGICVTLIVLLHHVGMPTDADIIAMEEDFMKGGKQDEAP